MKRYTGALVLAVGSAMVLLGGCKQPSSPPDTRTADEAAIREADTAWSQATGTGDVDAMLAFYADDAAVLAPHEPMTSDPQERRKMVMDMYAMPGFSLSWQVTKVEVARSSDIGYSLGTYQMAMNDAEGKAMNDHGKYATVWRKQPDGSWKVIVDVFNTDVPAAAPQDMAEDAAKKSE